MADYTFQLRRMLIRLVTLMVFVFLGYLVFGPVVCDGTFRRGEKRLSTVALFHNLRSAMGGLLSDFSIDEQKFPKDMAELARLLKGKLGITELGTGEPLRDTLRDGWGRELRLEGSIHGYVIRSAGRDGKFETKDDISLKGDTSGETVFDGFNDRSLTLRALQRRRSPIPFEEPNGYYRLSLPGSFSIIPHYKGDRSMIDFRYTAKDSIIITAYPDPGPWDPGKALDARLERPLNGQEEEDAAFTLVRSGILTCNGASGYEIRLRSASVETHEIVLKKNGFMSVRIKIVSESGQRREIVDVLEEEIESNLLIH